MDCIFCKIAAAQIKADVVYQDEQTIAFRDVNPQAPVHVLVIPKKHIVRLSEVSDSDGPLIAQILRTIQKVAELEGVTKPGFRVVINNGVNGGQTVDHLHYHLLGGRRLTWPPG